MTSSPHKALVAPTLFCEVTLKVNLNPASRLGTVILVVSTLLIETGTAWSANNEFILKCIGQGHIGQRKPSTVYVGPGYYDNTIC